MPRLGVTGLIKTILSLKHRTIPKLAHFTSPNPELHLGSGPFTLSESTKPWLSASPLRAGVSAFGVGGVNAHVVVEEAPYQQSQAPTQTSYPVCISARTSAALERAIESLCTFLESNPELSLANVSFTLAHGRQHFTHRRVAFAQSLPDLVTHLRSPAQNAVGLPPEVERWMAGGVIDWLPFFGSEKRLRISLPTYSFERAVHWIEPPPYKAEASPAILALQPAPKEAPNNPDSPPRRERLEAELANLLYELSGIEFKPEEYDLSLLELGFDSLFVTQATQSLERAFGVKISFRHMMEDLSSVRLLAEHLDAKMPPDPVMPAPIESSTPRDSSVEAIVSAQIATLTEMFSAQVVALRQAIGAAPTPVPIRAAAFSAPAAGAAHGTFSVPQKTSQEMTSKQELYLADLIARYVAKTPESKRLTQEGRRHLADPRVVAGFRPHWKEMVYPIITDRASGSRLWDVDGNEYIDIVNGFGCIMFGHSPTFVLDAIKRQLDHGVAIGPQSPLAVEVADLVCSFTGNERATFCNTGSEAVMAAIRIARTVTNRDRIVYFTGDYHGTFDEVLVRRSPRGSAPIAPGIPNANVGNTTVLEYGTEDSLAYLREHAHELAAVLIEPVQTRHPALQPIEFLREVRAITERSDTAMILDEVVTGFRSAPGGIQEYFGIRADLCTYGKVIGGGHPIGILSGKARYMDTLDGGIWEYGDDSVPEVGMTFFAGTFVRHPLALAAAKAVLLHLRESGPELQLELNRKTAALASSIDHYFERRQVPCRIQTFASWFYFTFPNESKLSSLFYFALRERGIHIQEGFPCFLTTAHSDEDFATIERAFRDTIDDLIRAEVISGKPSYVEDVVPDVPIPMTEAQREIFLAASLSDEANCAFNESTLVRLKGPVDMAALEAAVESAFNRHDCLRCILDEDGEHLTFHSAFRGNSETIDLTHLLPADQESLLAIKNASESKTPFDLHNGPLIRATFLVFSDHEVALLISAHHLVLDGWSSNILLEEIGKIYSAGHLAAARLPKPASFARYAQREAQRRIDGDFDQHERFWVNQFQGHSPKLDLPLDSTRPTTKSYAGATIEGSLDRSLYEGAKKLGARNGCSLYVTLLSAFQLALHRLTQQDEVVVGISTAGQTLLGDTSLVGHCVHFLPILSEVREGEALEEHLRATRKSILDAQDHQEFTFGSLLQKLTIERDGSRLPLIEVQFNLEKVGEAVQFTGLNVSVRPTQKAFVNTDLFLNVVETSNGLEFFCDYNTTILRGETVNRWMAIWAHLLSSAIADPQAKIANLPILPTSERDLLLHDWNDTAVDIAASGLTHEMILKIAMAYPDRVAAECDGRQWTYADLAIYAKNLAKRLLRAGLQPEELVGICLERSLEMVGAVLAVMIAGGAYVPLDPRHPRERLAMIVRDAEIRLMLTGRDPSIDSQQIKLINVTGVQPSEDHELPARTDKNPLAYVIYTSGSTGVPKGVGVEHVALKNFLLSMQREPGVTEDDVLVAVTTLAFDIAGLELLLPLITGAKLVIATQEEVTDGSLLLSLIDQVGATMLQATPSHWRLLIDAGLDKSRGLKILCGGEGLPQALASDLLLCGREVWNLYGPTETTIWSTLSRVTSGDRAPGIGSPIANTQCYVLDAARQAVPIGVIGKLYLGGMGLARGYWRRPELTEEKFTRNPFGDGRIYDTGDLARWHVDGTLELVGRSDFQVKLRGYRIELGEIESAIRKHSDVTDVAVLQVPASASSPTRLVAFVKLVGSADDGVIPSTLEPSLRTSLPEYMVPSGFVVVETLPRTPNGKLDRGALLRLSTPEPPARPFVVASNDFERQMVSIWSEVLGKNTISTTESIFELGADSLLIFRLAARCQREGLPIRAAQILKHRSIVNLSSSLGSGSDRVATAKVETRIQAAPRQKFLIKKVGPDV